MPEHIIKGPVLRMRKAAEYCGISYGHLMNLRSRGEGPVGYHHGSLVVFYPDDLDAWLNSRLTREEDNA